MIALFDYPAKSAFGRVLPKSKIYEHARPTTAIKELFVRQVEQIVWAYKLAPETVNLPATKAVPEIQVFHVTLKTADMKDDILRCIDKAIPFPLIFELRHDGKCKAAACFKRPNEADGAKWVTSEYFGTGWVKDNAARSVLPVALNLGALYEKLLSPLMPYPAIGRESMQDRVARMEKIRARQHELEQSQARLKKEKQFNRKVEINAAIRSIRQDIDALIGAAATG